MKQKTTFTAALAGAVLAGALLGLATTRLILPVKAAPNATVPGALANLFEGKTYPLTLKAEQFDSSYHLVGFVDEQGNASLYATRGETVTAGGETLLVCYDVPLTKSLTLPPQPKAGEIGNLIYINLHAVQAIAGIIPITPAPITSTPTPAPPATP